MANHPDITFFNDSLFAKQHICDGVIYRIVESYFTTKKGFSYRREFILQKRMSCNECMRWLLDAAKDDIEFRKQLPIAGESLPAGSYARLITTNPHRDWETGAIDDFDLEFVAVSDETLQNLKKKV